MSDIAVRVEHLSKLYRLGEQRARYSTFRETLAGAASAPLRWLKGERRAEPNTIWALDDVSFEVKHGEAVGIIGRNGAGKSTLLKVLSRITKPTRGRVDIYGRVGSLLEVGTGFHPELTGRENIYLNGAILGMTRREIQRKFDEIVDFAEIEKFLDTPVKFYSSGMYVRLAFAVAAHLEPEILVVDEVLAVGDAEFQKKCLGKMGDVAHEGRTVLFVSHNMGAVSNLCPRALLLKSGFLSAEGDSSNVISKYQSLPGMSMGSVSFEPTPSEAYFLKVDILNSEKQVSIDIPMTDSFEIRFEYVVSKILRNLDVAFILRDKNSVKIFTSSLSDNGHNYFVSHPAGNFLAQVTIPSEFLAPGLYSISPAIHEFGREIYDFKDQAIQFRILDIGSARYKMMGVDTGAILVKFNWNIQSY